MTSLGSFLIPFDNQKYRSSFSQNHGGAEASSGDKNGHPSAVGCAAVTPRAVTSIFGVDRRQCSRCASRRPAKISACAIHMNKKYLGQNTKYENGEERKKIQFDNAFVIEIEENRMTLNFITAGGGEAALIVVHQTSGRFLTTAICCEPLSLGPSCSWGG